MSTASGGYDLMLQFEEDLLNDILARALDDPLTLAAQSPRLVPRQVGFPAAPPNAKTMLWWEQPAFTVAEGALERVSVLLPIHGGAQHGHSIYSVQGVVAVERPVRLRQTSAGAPYLALSEPAPWGLRLQHLHFSHGQTPVDPAAALPQVGGYLVGALSVALQALARVPFSYAPAAPRLAFPVSQQGAPSSAEPAPHLLRLGSGAVQTLVSSGVQGLALGFTLAGSPSPAPTPAGQMTPVLPAREGHGASPAWLSALTGGAVPNLALTFSARGLTAAFAQVRETGMLTGETTGGDGARTGWRWQELSVALQPGVALLTGSFALAGAMRSVQASVRCALDTAGRLRAEPIAVHGGASSPAEERALEYAVADSWKTLLLRLLRAAPRHGSADRFAPDALAQRLWLPETRITVETQAAALLIGEGELTALYGVPQSLVGVARNALSKID